MLTDIEGLCLFDMLPTRNKSDLIEYFKKLPDKQRVKVLTMDLWNVYRQVAQSQFPGRMVVADRFHVVRMANDSIERLRKEIRKGLETKERIKLKDDRFVLLSRRHSLSLSDQAKLSEWSERFPAIGMAYGIKESFHDIYNQPTKIDAMKAAKEWDASIPDEIAWAFRETRGALSGWWDEIFHWYDYPITNGYTESVNNLAKGMNRMGRGYSFEVIRARLLYEKKALKSAQASVRPKPRKVAQDSGAYSLAAMGGFVVPEDRVQTTYRGAHIPTLVKLLDEGYFE